MNTNSPYIPKQAIFHESVSRPELFNEQNNRIERVIGEMKEIIKDAISTKNIVMSAIQQLNEITNKNAFAIYNKLEMIETTISALKQEHIKTNEYLNDIYSHCKKVDKLDAKMPIYIDDEQQ